MSVSELRPVAEPDVARLLNAYAEEVRERFDGGVACCSLDPLVDDDVELFAICRDGRWVGCAGLRPLGGGVAELKRMYVAPEARGTGLGRRLLSEVEAAARERGYTRVRLDTGEPMPEAQALYRSAGYREIPDYNGNPAATYWAEKELG